ncbi:MAG: excinuclease ABC subunit UvrC [Bacteroidales bacterium]|nr:excinuclease ABC subunit UvrC [Bacteroidales bacterium]MCF8333579.1 excinuclease ABC subunit UvrC [Bacteroidales bacterium]
MSADKVNTNYEKLDPIIKTLPDKPGIYQYFDEDGKIIYIGKAKNLKKRVTSYFTKAHEFTGRIRLLVKRIADIRTMVVDSETDALLLENNLIKKYQPRYNVQLKDDKTYPWICIKNEPFPRVFSTRNLIKDGSEYFGPYASVRMMNTLLDLIRQLYPLRTCNYNLTEENINKGKFKVCLEYHLGNCKGPCEGLQTKADYDQTISHIRNIIKGNINSVIREFKNIMMDYADKMEFEKAQRIKNKLDILTKFQSKSTVVSPNINNVEVYSLIDDKKSGYVNFLKIVSGAIIQTHTIELKRKLDESAEKLLSIAITEFRQRFDSDAREIIVPFEPEETPGKDIEITIPQRGDKKHLLELSERNAKYYKFEKEKRSELVDPDRHKKRLVEQIRKDLGMKESPVRIECFDNSNFQGDYPVSAMVHFKNAQPLKKEYRHYNIKTVEGPNDYASMEEVMRRRYKRLLNEEKPLPQLIVIDGGKGQLNAAYKTLKELGLEQKISVIGIAKRLEEIYKPGDPVPMYLDKTSESLKVIQRMRDEAHRFGITHHRKRLQKGTIKTSLTEIKGIGETTATELLSHFKSLTRIKQAGEEEIAKVIGPAKAKLITEHFSEQKEQNN